MCHVASARMASPERLSQLHIGPRPTGQVNSRTKSSQSSRSPSCSRAKNLCQRRWAFRGPRPRHQQPTRMERQQEPRLDGVFQPVRECAASGRLPDAAEEAPLAHRCQPLEEAPFTPGAGNSGEDPAGATATSRLSQRTVRSRSGRPSSAHACSLIIPDCTCSRTLVYAQVRPTSRTACRRR